MKKLFVFCFIFMLMITCAIAETDYKVGTANTSVYVRTIDTGDIAGSLAYGDKVYVEKIKDHWCIVHIGDETYKVYSDYVSFHNTDDTDVRTSIRKQGDAKDKKQKVTSNGIIVGSKSTHKIKKDSPFNEVEFW